MGRIEVTVNGVTRSVPAAPHTRLLDWLRAEGLTGSKEGCAEGECGACAVLVARPDGPERSRWTSINACLPPVAAFDGQEIRTVEGLGTAPGAGSVADLHPVQREIADRGGSQCGYCTPGFVCSMAAEYYRPDREPTDQHDAEHGPNGFDLHALGGNLCRCTGYRPLRDAAFALGSPDPTDPLARRQDGPAPAARHTRLAAEDGEFLRPATVTELLDLLAERPDATLVAGATDLGVEVNLRAARPRLVLAIDRLADLRTLDVGPDRIEIGAALTLSEIERALAGQVPLLDELLPQFGSRLIRNCATLGGSLATASPVGDAAPALLALDASVVLTSRDGEREVGLPDFFTGYRQTVRTAREVIRAVRIPLPLASTTTFQKITRRRFDDISSVAVAIALRLDDGVVAGARIGLGGVAATPIRARATEDAVTGQRWDAATAARAAVTMSTEGTPLDDHRASARYRTAMLEQALPRFLATSRTARMPEVTR